MRERRGWSQNDLAREAGMTKSEVVRFEAGGTIPTLPVLERLARALTQTSRSPEPGGGVVQIHADDPTITGNATEESDAPSRRRLS
ncbi:helix-turn-helix transcriptional regulator [Streptosporangium sp. KLBMP 9127]|nr:helix-turn-helix transcriptional regulator [Streptosporangium sp. KLBMP 9127]